MTTIPTIVVTPSTAVDAYGRVDRGDGASAATGGDFSATLARAMQGAIDQFHVADADAAKALTGGGNLTEVVMALSRAELALQTTTAVRDRVLQAYQDIIKMTI